MANDPPAVASVSETGRPENRLLAALPDAEFSRLAPELKLVAVRPRQVIQEAGEPIRYVYFPTGGVFSVTSVLPDGTMVEVATVGDEGMFCVEAILHDAAIAPGHALMQVPGGSAIRLDARILRREIAAHGALSEMIGRYAQLALAQIMQSTACNALHQLQERCARWLLMTHDRVRQQEFQLSHEFLAMMLGARRPTVTLVAGALQSAGLITYRYGRLRIVNRRGLEAAACPCYAIIRAHSDRLGFRTPAHR